MITGIRTEPVPASQIPSAANFANTFLGNYQTVRLLGPFRLIRLVQCHRHSQEKPGDYWMETNLFQQARLTAARDLASGNIEPAKRPGYAGMIVRYLLRDQLAICRDWSDLDAFVSLDLPAGSSVLALLGQAQMQPYYSPRDPAHPGAEAGGIRLPGLGTQIVIDFKNPENQYAARLVSSPMVF